MKKFSKSQAFKGVEIAHIQQDNRLNYDPIYQTQIEGAFLRSLLTNNQFRLLKFIMGIFFLLIPLFLFMGLFTNMNKLDVLVLLLFPTPLFIFLGLKFIKRSLKVNTHL
jgi:hypothetical protein